MADVKHGLEILKQRSEVSTRSDPLRLVDLMGRLEEEAAKQPNSAQMKIRLGRRTFVANL